MGMEGSTTVRAPSSLRLDVAELLRRPGASEPARLRAHVDGLRLELISVPGDIEIDARLDSIVEGIAVVGALDAVAEGECARCLTAITFPVHADVEEAFAPDAGPDDELYPIVREEIDLEPLIRDAIMLALPVNPVCRADCAGLCPVCGADRNTTACGHEMTTNDPRWDALRALRDQQDEMEG